MNEYRHLSAFPENRAVLQTLAERGIRAGVLSNGDPDMLDVAVRSAGLADLLDPILSVHATRRYKTDPAAYALGPAALGLAARRDPVRVVQLLGRDRRDLVRLHHAVDQPRRPADGAARHRAHAHRHSLRDVLEFF